MRRTMIKFILYASLTGIVLTAAACSSLNTLVPEPCTQGVPTTKNCFTTYGNKGAFGMGPFNVIHAKF